MGDCPQFTLKPIALELGSLMQKDFDQVLCSSLNKTYLVLGTQRGRIHAFNLHENLGKEEANYTKPILDIHCGKTKVAICQENRVAIHTLGGGLSHICDIEGVCTVRVVETAESTYLVAANKIKIWIIEHYWRGVQKREIRNFTSSPIYTLVSQHQVLVVISFLEIVILGLPSGSEIYQTKSSGRINCAWVTPFSMVLATSQSYRYVDLSEPNPGQITVSFRQAIDTPFEIAYIASCNRKWIITLSPDKTLRVMNLEGKVEFDISGQRVWLTACVDYEYCFAISDMEVKRLGHVTTLEQMDWLTSHHRYEEAHELLQTQHIDDFDIQRLFEKWLLHTFQTQTEVKGRQLCTHLLQTESISKKHVLEMICSNRDLLPLLTEVNITDVTLEAASQLIPSLLQKGDEQLLITCVRNWNLSLLHSDSLMQPLLLSDFTECKFELFLRRGQLEVAFEMLLNSKMRRIFRAFRDFAGPAIQYVSNMNSRQFTLLCEIDATEAIAYLVSIENLSQDRVLRALSEEMQVVYAQKLNTSRAKLTLKTELVLLKDILRNNLEEVLGILHNSALKTSTLALDLCQEYDHIEGQIFILSHLGRVEDLRPLLKANILDVVQYLQRYRDFQLSQELVTVLAEESQLQFLLPLACTYPFDSNVCDAISPSCRAMMEVHAMLHNMRRYRRISAYSLAVVHTERSFKQELTYLSLRRGRFVDTLKCAFCKQEMKELGLFRRCGHHIHLECEIDQNCRICERESR